MNETSSLSFVIMDDAVFDVWVEDLSVTYARDKVRTHQWQAEGATERAREEMARHLPERAATPGHNVFSLVDGDGNIVGSIWWKQDPPEKEGRRIAFIYYVEIHQDFRRRGHAEAALRLLEQRAADEGLDAVSLHVFGFNTGARILYEKLGYVATSIMMTRDLI